ncbi:hypothetical protein CPB84DRAFT_1744657 [Gymnopilus junonius]|uniref:Uncharacterized protein n=1 Tax=Gymnopilus junonius TaxID=109634 RepID=A0A9P5NXK0_GYMJU|nr:hypothetical protein CPB84DRAFT_1744657 [Gymnopilus junonius]
MTPGVVCDHSVSGGYGPISRFLYYVFLITTLTFHKNEWLLNSSGTCGGFGVWKGRGTVDFDVVPVYSITGAGMLIGTSLLVWSKTLREAKSSTRLLAFAWIAMMFVGAMALRASVAKLPTPLDYDDPTIPGQIARTRDLRKIAAKKHNRTANCAWKFVHEGERRDIEIVVNLDIQSRPSSFAVKAAKPHDTSDYFVEGRWWGTVANGLIMNHGGVKCIVHDGYLRRFPVGVIAKDTEAGVAREEEELDNTS